MQLALMNERGEGMAQANCTAATQYLRIFLAERTNWANEIQMAVDSHDAGAACTCHLLAILASAKLLAAGKGRSRTRRQLDDMFLYDAGAPANLCVVTWARVSRGRLGSSRAHGPCGSAGKPHRAGQPGVAAQQGVWLH